MARPRMGHHFEGDGGSKGHDQHGCWAWPLPVAFRVRGREGRRRRVGKADRSEAEPGSTRPRRGDAQIQRHRNPENREVVFLARKSRSKYPDPPRIIPGKKGRKDTPKIENPLPKCRFARFRKSLMAGH